MPDLGDQVFLSPAMHELTAKLKSKHADVFGLSEKLNAYAHAEIFATNVPKQDEQCILVACLLQRAMSAYQSVVLLVQYGLRSEALAILRVLIEITFKLVAISKDREIGRAYIQEDALYRKKFINKFKLLSPSLRQDVSNEKLKSLLESLHQEIQDNDIRERKTQWFAEQAGLSDFYHAAYSVLSGSVHVNVRDLESALEVDPDGKITGFRYGPTEYEANETLLTAIESLMLCLKGVFSILPSTSPETFNKLHDEFVEIFERISP